MNRRLRRLCLLMGLLHAGSAYADSAGKLTLSVSSGVETVFSWAQDRCEAADIPDTPLRAVRLAPDAVVAFSTHYLNRRFLGRSLNTLRRDCAVVFAGKNSPQPEDYSDRVWISSTWSDDGRTIFALGHDEYQAHRHPGRCRFSTYIACWYNAIVLLRSDDSGAHFRRIGERPVASIPIRQDVDQGHNRGFFEPSNIIEWKGDYYSLVRTGPEGPQKAGTCLFRTHDLTRPDAWRFFDGNGYSPTLDPYRDNPGLAKPCATLSGLQGIVGSVSYLPANGLFVAIMTFDSGRQDSSGFFYATSTDLVRWNEPQLLMAVATPWSGTCGHDRNAYPSLVDVESPSRNFDVLAHDPFLYFVRQRMQDCNLTMDRDLVRVRLSISHNQ